MAMSAQHRAWLASGGNWELCAPGRQLRDVLRARGYTVYDLGNDAHLDHQPPEDHTPYSATGWPGTSPYGVVMAIDIMPPPAGSGLPSLQVLGARLHADKESGRYPAIKYMNWGPSDDGHAVQCRWKPSHVQGSSTDTGHIHISYRTDYATYSAPYDPLGDEMIDMAQPVPGVTGLTVGDWMRDTWEWTATARGLAPVGPDGRFMPRVDDRFKDPTFQALLVDLIRGMSTSTPPPPDLTDAQLDVLADKVVAKLGALRFMAQ